METVFGFVDFLYNNIAITFILETILGVKECLLHKSHGQALHMWRQKKLSVFFLLKYLESFNYRSTAKYGNCLGRTYQQRGFSVENVLLNQNFYLHRLSIKQDSVSHGTPKTKWLFGLSHTTLVPGCIVEKTAVFLEPM